MRKTFNFGKVDFNRTGRKINLITVDVELREKEDVTTTRLEKKDKAFEFSACGDVWNNLHTDIICGGQCLDDLNHFVGNRMTFHTIYKFWKKYHLNGMKPGTDKQNKAIEEYRAKNNLQGWAYDKECEYLQSIGLFEDNGYKYGHGWLLEEIPEEDLRQIKTLFS